MRKVTLKVATALVMATLAVIAGAPTANADCHGTTGQYGCGPGWYWDGNRCIPC